MGYVVTISGDKCYHLYVGCLFQWVRERSRGPLQRSEAWQAKASAMALSVIGTSVRADTVSHQAARTVWDIYDERSRGYSLATRMSLNNREDDVRRIIGECIPDNRRLRVLDVGTGAGYAAIIMAQMGHDVVAVDYSEEMLEKARSNARQFRVDIMFIEADVENLDLDPFSFDVIVAKDVVWSLVNPVAAYSDWIHLLRPGGYLLVIDGNYYLDLYDEDYAKRRRYLDMKNGVDNNLHAKTNIDV